jgi:hypothetical protein
MTMDLDSTVCQVHGYHKQGAAHGYTRTLSYHPLQPPAPTLARSCTPASGPGGPTPPAERPASSTNWPHGCAAPAPAGS